MTEKPRWFLLDANIVIEAFRLELWERLVERCRIHLPRTVVEESEFFEDQAGERHPIDLAPWISAGAIVVVEAPLPELIRLKDQLGPSYLERLDPGEAEALAFLLSQPYPEYGQVCSADAIVFRILGSLKRGDQGVSFEEMLTGAGLSRRLDRHYSKRFRIQWTRRGFEEGLAGLA